MRLKDGRTRLGYEAEHVVDLDTGAIVTAEMYSTDEADTATLQSSLEAGPREHGRRSCPFERRWLARR